MIHVAGHITVTPQMLEDLKRLEAAWEELEWTATHYDEATPEQRARFDAFSEAVDRLEGES